MQDVVPVEPPHAWRMSELPRSGVSSIGEKVHAGVGAVAAAWQRHFQTGSCHFPIHEHLHVLY